MRRENYYNMILTSSVITSLPQIKTFGELKSHVGDVLIFGYTNSMGDIEGAWMGVLAKEGLDKRSDTENIKYCPIKLYGRLFIRINKFYNVLSKTKPLNTHTEVRICDAQKFIWVPDKKFISYYYICKMKLTTAE